MPPGHFENTNSTKIATGVALIRLFFTIDPICKAADVYEPMLF